MPDPVPSTQEAPATLPKPCGPARPLLRGAGVLAAGSFLGIGAASASWSAVLLAATALLLVLRTGGPGGARGAGHAAFLLALFSLGAIRAFQDLPRRPSRPPSGAEASGPPIATRDEPIVGRWRPSGRPGRGWIEPAGRETLGHGLLFDLASPAPPDGAWVAVLPGGEVLPWPRGPVPGPEARAGRFDALSPVAPDELLILHRPERNALPDRWVSRLRAELGARVRALERDGPGKGLVTALLLGDRRHLEPGLADLFTRTGVRHVLALSGLHVGIFLVAFLIPATRFLFAWLPRAWTTPASDAARERGLLATRLLLLSAYAVVSGAGAPVVRASLAAGLALCVPLVARNGTGRGVDPLSLWGLALGTECLVDPRGLTQLGLLLSYAATLGILVGTKPLLSIWSRPGSEDPGAGDPEATFLGPLPRCGLALVRRGTRWLGGGLAVSLSAVLATLPIVWSTFGEWCPLGALVTLAALPTLTVLLGLAWVGVLVPHEVVGETVSTVAEALVATIRLADRLPGTPSPLPERPALLVGAAVLATFFALGARRHAVGAGRLRVALLAWAAALLPWSTAARGFELHALDVGHGSSVVLRAPGLPALVFDAGSRDRGQVYEEAIRPLLARWEVTRPWIALSHDHGDHRSALGRLLERHPARVWLGALPARLGERLPHDATRLDVDRGRVRGAPLGLPGASLGGLEVVLVRGAGGEGNEGSRSLELSWRGRRVLLSGDAEGEGLRALLARGWLRGPLSLLLFPHHGSDTPLSGPLLETLRPREVWVSSADPPPVGPELTRRGIPWRWTGASETLALYLP